MLEGAALVACTGVNLLAALVLGGKAGHGSLQTRTQNKYIRAVQEDKKIISAIPESRDSEIGFSPHTI